MTLSGGKWSSADFTASESAVWAEELKEYDQWMTHRVDDKIPFAPWTSSDAPAPCSDCGTTTAECEHSAKFKWGWEENRRPWNDAMMSLADPKCDGLVFIQTASDPFVFVDGDDVRCPETGEVHPAFEAVLSHLGLTYADISVSGTGVHAYYTGTLPGDETVATWEIDDSPWGVNDDLPAIEIYSGKHVCVTTGKRVPGAPATVSAWNGTVARKLLEANGELTQSFEIDSSASTAATKTDGGPSDDPIRALRRLDPVKVAEKTIVDEWTPGGGAGRTFLPTWGDPNDGGTANFVDSNCWVDTGKNGGRGGAIEMALIDLGELDNKDSEVGYAKGADFWTGYDHLRDLGFDLPEPDHADGDDEPSDYYDLDLASYHTEDVWSNPDAMLGACLRARAVGAVDRDRDPPTMALVAIVNELLDTDNIGEGTKEMAKEVYHNELTSRDLDSDGFVSW